MGMLDRWNLGAKALGVMRWAADVAASVDPEAGGAGTGVGIANPGAICIDTTNGDVYRNSGTQAAPAWTQLADVP